MTAFYPVVPAGGSGTRLWPLSRSTHPKFLYTLTGTDRSLIQATLDRLNRLAPTENTFVVTGAAHAVAIGRQLPNMPSRNIIVEPGPRNSGPAIGLAAALIARRDPAGVMGSFAADHLVDDVEDFVEVVQTAIQAAEEGYLVTVGITPTGPETGYGYIRLGAGLDVVPEARTVAEFKEKPSLEVARHYLESGQYVWNAGMFVWRASTLLDELARQLPDLHDGLVRIAADWDTPRQDETLATLWPTLPKISIDHGVMEGAAGRGRVAVVPGSFGWNDIGDWDTLGTILPKRSDGVVVVAGDSGSMGDSGSVGDPGFVLTRDCQDAVVAPMSGRLVALVGVRDIVVVDTPDALLVCARDHAQDVKTLVDSLKDRGEAGLC